MPVVANQRGIRSVYAGPEEPLNADTIEVILGTGTEVLPAILGT
jgi:NAD-dependent deacetylase